MPEPPVITNNEGKEKSIGQEVREKSFYELLKENKADPEKPIDEKPEETEEEKKKLEEEKAAKEAQEAKEKVEAEEQAKKRDEEIAAKAAQDVIDKQKADEQAKADKIKAEEEAKQRAEDLKPKFTGKDKDGNVVPKSYEELHAEDVRVAEERAVARIHAELEAKEAKAKEEQAKVKQTEEQKKAQTKAFEDQLQKELDADLNDLYLNNKLPKVKDPKDENYPGNKEFKNLFETAQKVNAERMAKGEPPIRSIKLIYYEHYKPLAKPAGHDAPVMGNESSITNEAPEDKYVVSRDRNKSMQQLLKEEAQRLTKKLNVRGA